MKSVKSAKTRKQEKTKMSTFEKQTKENLPAHTNPNALPAYLQKRLAESQHGPVGVSELNKYWVPPRAKIVQSQSGEQYKKQFQIGDVVLVPEMSLIAHSGEAFWITPIFQFTEFCKWSPYAYKGQLPVIIERNFDNNSHIAKRAMSKKEADWYEIYDQAPKNKQGDQQYQFRYCEHINFLCVLRYNPKFPELPANRFVNNPFLISFHHSGFYEGKQLSTFIVNRRMDIFSGQYEFKTTDKQNAKGNWKGFAVTNPSLDSGLGAHVEDEKDYLNYEAMYKGIQRQFEQGEIRAEYEDEAAEGDTVADSKKF